MQINSQKNNQQSFGMLRADELAKRALKSRLKAKEIQEFENIVAEQAGKRVNIDLFQHPGANNLSGSVYTQGRFYETHDEGFFASFGSPLKFIKKLVKIAENKENWLKEQDGLDNIMDYLS